MDPSEYTEGHMGTMAPVPMKSKLVSFYNGQGALSRLIQERLSLGMVDRSLWLSPSRLWPHSVAESWGLCWRWAISFCFCNEQAPRAVLQCSSSTLNMEHAKVTHQQT